MNLQKCTVFRMDLLTKKEISSLGHHKEDFEIEAEWHFYVTVYGKDMFVYQIRRKC